MKNDNLELMKLRGKVDEAERDIKTLYICYWIQSISIIAIGIYNILRALEK